MTQSTQRVVSMMLPFEGSESIWLTVEIMKKISTGSSQAVAAFNEGICIGSLILCQNSSNDEAVKLRDYVKIWGLVGRRGIGVQARRQMIEDGDRLKFDLFGFYSFMIRG